MAAIRARARRQTLRLAAFAPSLADWVARRRGSGSSNGASTPPARWSLPPQQLRLPASSISSSAATPASTGSIRSIRRSTARMMSEAKRLTAPYRDSPYRIGYFSDNEVGWWARRAVPVLLAEAGDNFTKQRWVAMLRRHLSRRLAALRRRFRAARRASIPGPTLLAGDGERRGCGRAATASRRCALDRHRRRALLRARRRGDPRRRSRRALFRRPAADLLRPGGGARRGAACRRDRHQLQCRQPAKAGSRPISSTGCGSCRGGKPVLVSEWFFAAAREPHRQPQQRPSDDGRDAGRARRGRGRGGGEFRRASRDSSGCTGSSITTIRKAAAPTARTTISASSTSTTGPTSGSSDGAGRRQPASCRESMPRRRPRRASGTAFAVPARRDRSGRTAR